MKSRRKDWTQRQISGVSDSKKAWEDPGRWNTSAPDTADAASFEGIKACDMREN